MLRSMKLLVPLPLRQRLRHAATRRCSTTRSSNNTSKAEEAVTTTATTANSTANANGVPSVRAAANPGTVRVRRGTDPRAKEIEMDTTIARIMGSDWGDRSKQPVSLAMRLYWGIFIIVLANGAFTYFAGKDEKFLVDKVQKKVDEKLGRVETNEFVVMADQQNKPSAAAQDSEPVPPSPHSSGPASPATAVKAAPVAQDSDFRLSDAPSKSMFSSNTVPTPMPYFGAPVPQRATTKADYERQLQQLRLRQARANEERKDPSRFRSIDEIDLEIKRIDQQKAQLKQILKKL